MTWFLAGAAVSLGAFNWSGTGGSKRFWALAFAAFSAVAISAGRYPSVVFVFFFLLATALLGVGAVFRRLGPGAFAAFAASDVALVLALWLYQNETAGWLLPKPGLWASASAPAAVAALIRLAAPALVMDRDEELWRRSTFRGGPVDGALLSVGWWQGAMLAWWVGASAPVLLSLGGLALWAFAFRICGCRVASFAFAGGLLAVAAALGLPALALACIGFAGLASVLGDRGVSVWVLGVLPVSILTAGAFAPSSEAVRLPEAAGTFFQAWRPAGSLVVPSAFPLCWAVLFPAGWSAASAGLSRRLAGRRTPAAGLLPYSGVWLAGTAAGAAGLLWIWSKGNQLVWAAYGAVLAWSVSGRLGALGAGKQPAANVEPAPGGATENQSGRPDGAGPGPGLSKHGRRRPGPGLMPAGWAALAVALALAVRLTWVGLGTGFL